MNEDRLINPIHPRDLSRAQQVRATGAIIGSAAGDAVGAPFEFKEPGLYGRMFPEPVKGGAGEMVGGGAFNWAPGEFTDDTQMAVALAEALLAADGYDPDAVWGRFRAWSAAARDVGITTSYALSNASWQGAALASHNATRGRSASNGCVMRIAPVGVMGVRVGRDETMRIAVAQASLTHHDPAAAAGAALVAETIRLCILTGRFMPSLNAAFDWLVGTTVGPVLQEQYAHLVSGDFDPHTHQGPGNGSVWTAVAQAVWAVRTTASFHDAMVAAIQLGDDTDTVAAIAGAMAGAVYGLQGIPSRWTTYLHGYVTDPEGREVRYDAQALSGIARRLLGKSPAQETPPEDPIDPRVVHPAGVLASNLLGATLVDPDTGVVSLCMTGDRFLDKPYRRTVYMRDESGDHNPRLLDALTDAVDAVDAFLAEGRKVVVHCHGGRSRTAFVLKAWYMRHEGVSHAEAHEWMSACWPHYRTWTSDFWDMLESEWTDHVVAIRGAR